MRESRVTEGSVVESWFGGAVAVLVGWFGRGLMVYGWCDGGRSVMRVLQLMDFGC